MKCKRLLLMLLVALLAPWAAMAQQALPYSYGFENNDLSAEGWSTQNPSGLDASEFGISADAKKTGDYGFRFSSYYDDGDHTQYLISPELNATTGVVAQFYYRASSGSGTEKFKVGYSTTDTDIASFNFGSEISTSSTSWTQSAEFTFPAGTKYVAIYYYSDYQYRLFVDDLTFEAPASCPKPTGLVVSNITHNEAKLSWTENGTATSWQVCLNNDETNLITANSNPYTLTGLTPTTAYTAKVRAIGYGEFSAWSNEVSFSTTAEAEAVGDAWSDDFEGTACGWELINGTLTNQWVWGTAVNNGGTHALYVSNDGGATNNYSGNNTKIFATKLLNFAEGKYEFSYDWLCKGESTWDFLRVALVPASETLTAGTDYATITQPSLPTGWIALDGGKLNLQETWQSKDVAINVAAGNYYLVLAWRNETGAYSPAAAVDNVSITRVACGYDVTGLAAGDITTTSADITWTAGEATGWQVAYKTNAASDWKENEPVSTNSTTLSGLAASTNYQVKVRAYCGGQDYGSWCDPITFATACDVITDFPWSENFDSYSPASVYTPTTRELPVCWNFINECTYSSYMYYPSMSSYTPNSYAHSASNYLKLYSFYSSYTDYNPQPQYAILPEMSSLAGKEVVLYARGYNDNSTFKIGTMSDPEDASTFNFIAEQTGLTTSYQKFSCIIPADRTDSYLAIMIDAAASNRTSNGVYIDDITVKEMVTVDADEIVAANPGEGQMTWNEFVSHWNNGDHFTSNTITLMEDISINEMVGTAENPFTGTFDGNGKTITGDITSGETAAAPFHYIKDATIKNLTMTGTVTETATTSDGYHAGGLVGYAWSGYNIIENCRVSTNVTIAGYGGGIVGHGKTSVVFLKGCVYDGTITNALNVDGNNKGVGGLVGWFDGGAALNIHDSYYNGTYTENEGVSVYFHPVACKTGGASVTVNIYDCYYTCDNPAADSDGTNNVVTNAGQKAYTVTGAEDITVDLHAATTHYSCSGISGDDNATWNGIKIGDDIYGGEGVTLALSLSGANGYKADHGTLTPISTTYTLLMEAYNTTISGVDCPVPYNVAVSNVEARSARVTWTGASDSYIVSYRTPGYFDGATEGFGTLIPTGWENKVGLLSGVMEGTTELGTSTTQWIFSTSNGVFDNHARINIYGSSTSERHGWLITPSIEVGNGYVLTFDLALTAYNGTVGTPSTAGTDDRFVVLVSTDDEATWTILREWNNSGSSYVYNNITCSATGENVSIDLSSYAGQTVRIAFYGESTVSNADNNLHIDNVAWGANIAAGEWQDATATVSPFQITGLDPETDYEVCVKGNCGGVETEYSEPVPFTTIEACSTPSEFTVGEVTTHTAAISWNGGNAESWTMFVKKSTETDYPASGEVVNTPAKTLESLDAATTYDVKIVAGCDENKVLEVAEAFTTECDVFTVDLTHSFTEGFEGTTFAPICWESIASGTYAWSRSTGYHHGDGSASAYSGYYGDIYLIMPDIQISSEADGAQLTFWSYNTWVGSYGKNSVVLINGENETELWSPESVSQSWVETTIDLSSYVGQTISLAFKYEGNNAHGWFIDDVELVATKTFTKTIAPVGEEGWANGKGGYYFIASPVAEPVTPTADNGFIAETAANYDLYYFNQAAPVDAETGIRLEWINFKETAANGGNFSIENGKGYLYASKEGTTLSFTGTPYSGDGQVILSKTDGADWAGWNLVGNPFAQDAYITKPFYTLENSDTYTPNEAGTAIQAMQGLLVVADSDEETVTFTTTAPVAKNSKLNMNLRRNNKQLDNAILVFGGDQKLGKMTFRANSSKVFMPVEGKDYAVVSAQGEVGEMPVSFKAENNGTYSLSFTSEEVSFSYLHLIDNMTGADVNLLQTPSYTFDARTTDYASRFKLVFAVGSSANDETFGFVNASGNFCIFGIEGEATVQVIDVLGHVLSSEQFSGSYERQLNVAPGVYMIRLIQGNDVKVQKVVVRR